MRLSLGLLIAFFALLVGTPRSAVAATSSCPDLSSSISAAQHAYVDYEAYADRQQSDDADFSWKIFTHLVDVAGHYTDGCDTNDLAGPYDELNFRVFSHDFDQQTSRGGKGRLARSMQGALLLLFQVGYTRTNRAVYATLKQQTVDASTSAGIEMRSPETGKVVVAENPALTNCPTPKRDASLASALTFNLPPEARSSDYHATFNVMIPVDADGNAGDVSVTRIGDHMDTYELDDEVSTEASYRIGSAKFLPAMNLCEAVDDLLFRQLEVSAGKIYLSSPPADAKP